MTQHQEPAVTFALRTGRAYTAETELLDHAEAWRAALAANENLEGILTIQAGEEEIHIEDDLDATVQNLCLRATVELLAGREARMLYFCCAGELILRPEGAEVRISGDFLTMEVVLPLRALVRSLIESARRFLHLLGVMNNPRHVLLIVLLQEQLDTADAAWLATEGAKA
jgi:hypothetical protein